MLVGLNAFFTFEMSIVKKISPSLQKIIQYIRSNLGPLMCRMLFHGFGDVCSTLLHVGYFLHLIMSREVLSHPWKLD